MIVELFEFLLQKYQEGLEESMKGSEFIFDSVDLPSSKNKPKKNRVIINRFSKMAEK